MMTRSSHSISSQSGDLNNNSRPIQCAHCALGTERSMVLILQVRKLRPGKVK